MNVHYMTNLMSIFSTILLQPLNQNGNHLGTNSRLMGWFGLPWLALTGSAGLDKEFGAPLAVERGPPAWTPPPSCSAVSEVGTTLAVGLDAPTSAPQSSSSLAIADVGGRADLASAAHVS